MREKVRTSYTDWLTRIAVVNRNVFVGSIPTSDSPLLRLPLQMIKRKNCFPHLKHTAKLPVSLHTLLESLRSLYFLCPLVPKFRTVEARASSKKFYIIGVYYLNSRSVNLH